MISWDELTLPESVQGMQPLLLEVFVILIPQGHERLPRAAEVPLFHHEVEVVEDAQARIGVVASRELRALEYDHVDAQLVHPSEDSQ